MRWPFRRKRETAQHTAAPAAAATTASAAPAAGATAPAPVSGGRHWTALPVIPVTVNRGAPLVTGPAPVLPPLRPSARRAPAPEVAPATGSVTGIAQPVPVTAAEPVVEAPPLPPAPVVRRATRSTPAAAPVLTDAVDEYVGEPREALEPYRAPSWLRYATNPGLPMLPGFPGPEPEQPAAEPPSFLPPEARSTPEPPPSPTPVTEPPPRMVEGVERAETPVQRPMRKRRPNLGQSRRLGLGAPIPAPAKEALVHPEAPPRIVEGAAEPATPQEPPPPPAAPVRVVAEREPEPAPEQRPEPEPELDPPAPPEPPAPPAPPPPSAGPAARPDAPVRPNPLPGPVPEKRVVATSYRASADLLPPCKPRPLPRATVVETVPPDLANAVRARQHVDVANVPVYRGPKVGEAAKARGAKAFASRGAVFLPDEAGPTDSPSARGLLAHELVHAVQQRTLGPVLPDPASPLGQHLEAEAQAAERFYGGEAGADEPVPLIHAPMPAAPSTPDAEPDMSAAAQLAVALASGTVPTAAPAATPSTPSQSLQSPFDAATRTEVDKIATESAKHVVEEWTNPHLRKQEAARTAATAAAAGAAVATAAYDRDARREVLIQQRLDALNQNRFTDQLTDLDDAQKAAIEHELDMEEAGHGGVVAHPATPAGPVYRKNSPEAWVHAITGMNAEYGLGLTGFRDKYAPGSEKSWFREPTEEEKKEHAERPLANRLLDATGLSSVEAENQFSPSTWFEEKDSGSQPPHEEWKYGKPNPDGAMIDVSRLDLDELANRLYDRVRSRLRIELLVDRERAGLLTDFR